MAQAYDLFLSYRRHDIAMAKPLIEALGAAGIRVWYDVESVPDFAPITPQIRAGLASCKALLALYSASYPDSNACQQELATAWIAAQKRGVPSDYVFIVNPEHSHSHIPEALADTNRPVWTGDRGGLAEIARSVRSRLGRLSGTLGTAADCELPQYHGMSPVQAQRFVGRVPEMWQMHGHLTSGRTSITSGNLGLSAAHACGMGGNGKTLFAREYAIRFGPAFPGGVFWLNAYGDDTDQQPQEAGRESNRQTQILGFATEIGIETSGREYDRIEADFWNAVNRNAKPVLWIVDDVPPVAPGQLERLWAPRSLLASMLVTTRSRGLEGAGPAVEIGVLPEAEATRLLTRRLRLRGEDDRRAIEDIARTLGYHPLAIEVAGGFLAFGTQSAPEYLNELTAGRDDAVEYGALLSEALPTGHVRSIAATLLSSVRTLDPDSLGFLRLASELAVAPIPIRLVVDVFERLGVTPAHVRAAYAVDKAASLSLCMSTDADTWSVHALVSRTVARCAAEAGWKESLRVTAQQALAARLRGHVEQARRHSEVAHEIVHARHLAVTGGEILEVALLQGLVARYDEERRDVRSARELGERALKICANIQGENHEDTSILRSNLAITMQKQGDLAAARLLSEKVLQDRLEANGEDDRATLQAMNIRAEQIRMTGDLAGARKLQERVLERRQRVLGAKDLDTLTSMNNMALILLEEGDVIGAERFQRVVADERRRQLGDEDPLTLLALRNLGITLRRKGDLTGARDVQTKVLEATARTTGDRSSDTTVAAWNLVMTLGSLKEVRTGEAVAKKYLLWMLDSRPDSLSADQRKVHDMVSSLMRGA